MKKRLALTVGILLISTMTHSPDCAGAAKAPARSKVTAEGLVLEHPPVSRVIRDQMTGLNYETLEQLATLEAQGHEFLDLKTNELSDEQEAQLVARCRLSDVESNPFCPSIIAISDSPDGGEKSHRKPKAKRKIIQTLWSINNGKLERLVDANEPSLFSAFKRVKKIQSIEPLIKKALEAQDCKLARAINSLALRVEKEFPNPKYKQIATELYEKVAACSGDTIAAHATYRLGLIKIWAGDYQKANEVLAKAMDSPAAADFRLRIAYWRYHCAEKMGDERIKGQMRELLAKEYPLSLHGLLANTKNIHEALPMLDHDEPEVAFRTRKGNALNALVRAVEVLQRLGAPHASTDILDTLIPQVQNTEVSFKLYVGVLLMQGGDAIKRFQYLATLFHENPSLITKASLELLYPVKNMDSINKFATDKMDPFLVLSLIRQESAFNSRAKSPTGALGLMQVAPTTARNLARVSKKQLYDPATNVRIGVKYFKKLLKRYDDDVELALAAYNAGPERIKEWQKRYPTDNRLLFLDLMPVKETREYVSSIVRNYFWYNKLYAEKEEITPAVATARFSAFQIFKPVSQ